MIKFQAIRKWNKRPAATGIVGKKKLATFICYSEPFRKLNGKLVPRGEIIECKIKGVPLFIHTTQNKTNIRPRQLFTRHFDFYEVK